LFSVAEAAAELKASKAYIRRMLARQRLYGIKLGSVWAIFPDDVEAFKRTRRPAGRPRKLRAMPPDGALDFTTEREDAATGQQLGN
jgi:excisionase family DNA binding protein